MTLTLTYWATCIPFMLNKPENLYVNSSVNSLQLNSFSPRLCLSSKAHAQETMLKSGVKWDKASGMYVEMASLGGPLRRAEAQRLPGSYCLL